MLFPCSVSLNTRRWAPFKLAFMLEGFPCACVQSPILSPLRPVTNSLLILVARDRGQAAAWLEGSLGARCHPGAGKSHPQPVLSRGPVGPWRWCPGPRAGSAALAAVSLLCQIFCSSASGQRGITEVGKSLWQGKRLFFRSFSPVEGCNEGSWWCSERWHSARPFSSHQVSQMGPLQIILQEAKTKFPNLYSSFCLFPTFSGSIPAALGCLSATSHSPTISSKAMGWIISLKYLHVKWHRWVFSEPAFSGPTPAAAATSGLFCQGLSALQSANICGHDYQRT